ncbi:MAG: hypothetical protein AAF682_00295 [Planctomycetota bacterium]
MSFPEITALVRKIKSSRPDNSIDQQTIVAQLREFRDVMSREEGKGDTARLLDAGVVLLENVEEFQATRPELIFDLLSQIVESVERRILGEQSEKPRREGGVELKLSSSDLPVNTGAMLGDLMKSLGMITSGELDTALAVQTSLGLPLGEILIRIGAATKDQVEKGLKVQAHLRHDPWAPLPEGAAEDESADPVIDLMESEDFPEGEEGKQPRRSNEDMLFGDILLEHGFATQEQIDEALEEQLCTGVRVGEALIQAGVITWEQLLEAVETQSRLRHVAGHPNRVSIEE